MSSKSQAATERKSVPARFKWKTTHLFSSDKAWRDAHTQLRKQLPKLKTFKGKLRAAESALKCLNLADRLQKQVALLDCYASRKNDQDTTVTKYQAMKTVADKLAADLETYGAYIEPELLDLPTKELQIYATSDRFSNHDRYLSELLRQKDHVLSSAEEVLLAQTSLIRDTAHDAFATFSAADLVFPKIKDERGRSVQLTQSLFPRYRASSTRAVRKQAFERFFGTYDSYRNTFASLLQGQVNANIVFAKARRYESSLQAALNPDELPTVVYHNMVKAVRKHLPKLHRYLRLRQRILKLRKAHYYDLYAPIVPKARMVYSYDQACQLLIDSAAPLGEQYCKDLTQALDPRKGWVDALPNKGKRGGAYMDGSAYDVHPYVLGNYVNDYNSVSMLAHEMGHAMHSHYSNAHQPYSKSDYSIFVAEVASTLNEDLLIEHMLKKEKKRDKRLFLLGERLEGIRQTFFRQALFAEFELEIYQQAEANEALTAGRLNDTYLALVRKYYGHPRLTEVDQRFAVEWAQIPHFYYNFYVFQYVTGVTAASALSAGIVASGNAARDRYINRLLKAGCSKAPIAILKDAGVDLTTSAPYDAAMKVFERTLSEAESLALKP